MSAAPRIRRRQVETEGSWPPGLSPLLRRIYAGRGASSIEHAQPRLAQLLPPDSLAGLAEAIPACRAIAAHRHIVVVGDFDCDGATACAVAVRGLRMLGATRVTAAVPNRVLHGYGLSAALVGELAALEPDLLVTVDHGIACHAGIAAAKALGWQVLVTDHHLPGDSCRADAIVNPNCAATVSQQDLAGVGVVFRCCCLAKKLATPA